jgi:SAM-dependent methyltransferase
MTRLQKNHNNNYTEIVDWEIHWKKFKPFVVNKSNLESLLVDFPKQASFIEIGGFPGFFSIYFKKYFNYDVHLLDYIIIPEILLEMERVNKLPEGSINQIKTDFFDYETNKKFDVVFSYGFIEHFEDTKRVVQRHVNLLTENGKLVIVLPNLRGMSGWFLKLTDPTLYKKHNIKCMDVNFLKDVCQEIGLRNVEVGFYGKPHIWINASSPIDSKIVRFFVKYFNGLSQRIPKKNYFLSPLIYIKAVK